MGRSMFGEPLLAHPAEMSGVHPTWHAHSGEDDDRSQRGDHSEDEQHGVSRRNQVVSRRIAIVALRGTFVCAVVHTDRLLTGYSRQAAAERRRVGLTTEHQRALVQYLKSLEG